MPGETTRPLSWLELFLICGAVAILGVIALPGCGAVGEMRESKRANVCAAQLKEIGIALQMYAAENAGHLPPPAFGPAPSVSTQLSRDAMFAAGLLIPKYLPSDKVNLFVCPDSADATLATSDKLSPSKMQAIASQSYLYLGWYPVGPASDLGKLYTTGVRQVLDGPPGDLDADVTVDRDGVKGTLVRLGDAAATAAGDAAKVPVMADSFMTMGGGALFNHLPGGSNVLYLDGHVDFVKYPTAFPMDKHIGTFVAGLPPDAVDLTYPPNAGGPV